MSDDSHAPIGVFDSGMGGLTVLRELERALPGQAFVYLGDTARLPYGTKSPETVQRYAVQAARCLVEEGVRALVVACNTASAVALDVLARQFRPLPVFGVVEPGAAAACAASRSGRIGVLATESTVAGGAYQRAILGLRPDAVVRARAGQVLVALAEAGRVDDDLARLALTEYLRGLQRSTDTLLLGCTHFPVFAKLLRQLYPGTVVDSAATTASAVAAQLGIGLPGPGRGRPPGSPAGRASRRLMATDGVDRFRRVGALFLGEAVEAVELVDIVAEPATPER